MEENPELAESFVQVTQRAYADGDTPSANFDQITAYAYDDDVNHLVDG